MERQFLKPMKKSARIRQEWHKREIRRSLYRLHRILHTPTVLSHLWLNSRGFSLQFLSQKRFVFFGFCKEKPCTKSMQGFLRQGSAANGGFATFNFRFLKIFADAPLKEPWGGQLPVIGIVDMFVFIENRQGTKVKMRNNLDRITGRHTAHYRSFF